MSNGLGLGNVPEKPLFKMTAELWIDGKACRVVVYDDIGNVIDKNDQWNNRASAESWVLAHYPLARIEFLHLTDR